MARLTRRRVLAVGLSAPLAPLARAERSIAPARASDIETGTAPGAAARALNWLELHNLHTGRKLRVTFRDASGFIASALGQLDRLLGDHRSGEYREMDRQLYVLLADLAAAAHAEPRYEIISGYRSRATNDKLRANGGGQAKNSQHIEGKAADVRLKGVPTAVLRDIAVSLKRGGVGWYPKSDFVHVDTARVRYWEG
ncbi:MAG: DUF882 domain-containing protein [Steroidobacteraceae bacterium]|nr:DUF882 domain-containing protein [Steroidobacteraceae bacterium]